MNYKDRFVTFKIIPTLDGKSTEGKIVDAIPIEWINNWFEEISKKNMNIERPAKDIKDMFKVYENILQFRRNIDLMINDWRIYDDIE